MSSSTHIHKSHNVSLLLYHLVYSTKYRRFVLSPKVDKILKRTCLDIEDRHGKRSTIIASQLPVETWHEIIGEETIADAILDRLVHSAHRINIKGESMRKKLRNKH